MAGLLEWVMVPEWEKKSSMILAWKGLILDNSKGIDFNDIIELTLSI